MCMSIAFAKNTNDVSLQHAVAFLSSDALEGRLTGTRGETQAAAYLAHQFQALGLKPIGDHGTFFQSFEFMSGVALGKNNFFSLIHPQKKISAQLNQDWRPLSFSKNAVFRNQTIIFAGYGITAPTYDSYQKINVKNKWVVVLRYLPEKIQDKKRQQLNKYASLRYKAFLARKKGALGIIFVSGPNAKVNNQLAPLASDTSLADAGILAISVSDAIAQQLLGARVSLQKLQNKLDTGKLLQPFQLTGIKIAGRINLQKQKKRGHNVVAQLTIQNGNAPSVVVGAHLDHLGYDESQFIQHGADDNASGVASVLAVAAKLSHSKWHGNKNIVFALWSGEELGLLGSTYFLNSMTKKHGTRLLHSTIDAYINLDMVGRLQKKLMLQGVDSSLNWPGLIAASNQHALTIVTQNDSYLPTDSTAFYLHGIPSVNFFTGSHSDYHKPTDTVDKINFNGVKKIINFLTELLLSIEVQKYPMNYQQIKSNRAHVVREFRVYLGTIPDYASAGVVGVKLAGVTKGSPSEQAGLKPNDVIVALAGKTIRDIYDYTFVLNALHANESVPLILLRDQKRITLTIVPQSRD